MQLSEQISKKWAPVLDHGDLPEIKDSYRRAVTALCLENTERQYLNDQAVQGGGLLSEALPGTNMGISTTQTGGTAGANGGEGDMEFADPVLISMVRRAMPQLIAYDICGVQPMSGPTGLVFALRARVGSDSTGAEALYNEADADVSGGSASNEKTQPSLMINASTGAVVESGVYDTAPAKTTVAGENDISTEMTFTIEKISTAAGTRALAGSYSMELAQDLRAVHGLDAEGELANILSAEILAEINREVVRRIQIAAVVGATTATNPGIFNLDTDSNGRWMVEKFKGLMFQIEREANAIAKGTRRGKGNIIITSSDVASALQMSGVLDYAPSMSTDITVDDAGNTFAGVLNGRYRVYVDPYQSADSNKNELITVGYKGGSPMDAGIFYCPYVPLQMVRAVDGSTFQPKIAFKTRYGMVANPFAQGITVGNGNVSNDLAAVGTDGAHGNEYYRKVQIQNLM